MGKGMVKCRKELQQLKERGVALVRIAYDLVPELETFTVNGHRCTAKLVELDDGTSHMVIHRHTEEPTLLTLLEAHALNHAFDSVLGMARRRLGSRGHAYYAVLGQELVAAARAVVA